MYIYICVFLTTIALFSSLFISIHHLFSKLLNYWILPSIISMVLFCINLSNLYLILSDKTPSDFIEVSLAFILSFSWWIFLFVYRLLLKKIVKTYTYDYDAAKIRNEAKYITKLELNRYKKRSKRQEKNRKKEIQKTNEAKLIKVNTNENTWDKLYD